MEHKYYLQVFIQKAGTPLNQNLNPNTSQKETSTAGHIWFSIYKTDEYGNEIKNSRKNAGYTPQGITNDDEILYLDNPACQSQELSITKEAYDKLLLFAKSSAKENDPENQVAKQLGFGKDDYNVLTNSCVDYAWKALELAGYNAKEFEGKLVPMSNCKKIQKINSQPTTNTIIINRIDLQNLWQDKIASINTFLFNFTQNDNNTNVINEVTIDTADSVISKDVFLNTGLDSIKSSNNISQMKLCLQMLDIDTKKALADKKVQIKNIETKEIYPAKFTDTRGYVCFEIAQKQRGDFFSVTLLNDENYEIEPFSLAKSIDKSQTHSLVNTIITPNNYQNQYAKIYVKAKISLLFNGLDLQILKGENIIQSFEARSGKPLTLAQKQELETNQGYKHFVGGFLDNNEYIDKEHIHTHTNNQAKQNSNDSNDLMQSYHPNKECFYCYDKGYQEDNQVIKEGEYYVNPNTLERFYEECELLEHTDIYTSKCYSIESQMIDTNNDDTKVSSNNHISSLILYKDRECKEKHTQIILSNNPIKALRDNKENIVVDNTQAIYLAKSLKQQTNQFHQTKINVKVQYTNNQVEKIVIHKHDSNKESERVIVDINKPFAPGTYIELEARGENISQSEKIYWKIDIRAIKQHHIQTFNQSIEIQSNTNNSYKAYLSTPQDISSYRQQGFSAFEVIIYASSNNQFDRNTPHIVFNLNFEVGDGLDSNVTESSNPQNDTTNKIYTLKQAVEFLRMTYVDFEHKQQQDMNFTIDKYFFMYPRIAGKIAYIYYRFDIGDEGFVRSVVKDNGEYMRDRQYYIKKIIYLFNNQSYKHHIFGRDVLFKDAYDDIFINPTNKDKIIEKRKYFIKKFISVICSKENLNLPLKSVRFFNGTFQSIVNNGNILNGFYKNRIININTLHIMYGDDNFNDKIKYPSPKFNDVRSLLIENVSYKHLMNTIFHEIRHFYIEQKYPNVVNFNILQSYIWHSYYFYIPFNMKEADTRFKKFYKVCVDKRKNITYKGSDDRKNVGCLAGHIQKAYEIQPNERDARYVAIKIVDNINLSKQGTL